jgi:predicted PurR-regulated permease PerM
LRDGGEVVTVRRGMTREQLFAVFFFSLLLFLLYQFYRIVSPFIVPLTWAALLALMFYPLQTGLTSLLRGRQAAAAFILTTAVIAVVMVPMVLIVTLLTNESVALFEQATEMLRDGELPALIERLRTWVPDSIRSFVEPYLADLDLKSLSMTAGNVVSTFIAGQLASTAINVASFVGNFFLTTFALFFFFRDGPRMVVAFRDFLPMEPELKTLLLDRLNETLSAVVQGTLVTAAAQGLLAGIGYWALGVPYSVFLGCLTALLALLPFGTPVAWGAVTGFLVFSGAYGRAILMVIWGIAGIGTIDNVLRPLIIGGKTSIPTVLLFFGILGGLQAYGLLGVFLAPTVIAILTAFARVYKERYATAG